MSVTALSAPLAVQSDRRPAGRLEGLDGLRGVAALCVLWFHASELIRPEWGLTGRGYLAVDFFFMLSGYVIARTYEHRLAAGYAAPHFLFARLRKLWPFMAIGALLGAPIVALQLKDPMATLEIVAANAFLIPTFDRNVLYPVNIAAWSIMAELAANVLHGLILWRLPTRALTLLCLVLVPLVGWIAYTHNGLAVGAETATTHLGIVRALLPYTMGIVLWRWWRDRPTVAINPALAFAIMPIMALLLPSMLHVGWLHDFAFSVLICPLLLAGGLAYRGSSAVLRWIGQISFPLYAINLPILLWSQALQLGLVLGITLPIGLASYLALRQLGGTPAKPRGRLGFGLMLRRIAR